METDRNAAALQPILPPLHVVFGSGGTEAVLAGTGAVLAFHVARMRKWQSIGGVSGGSIPAGLLASESAPPEFLRHVVDTDFERLMSPRTGLLRRMWAFLRKYRYEKTLPEKGAFATKLLEQFVDCVTPKWPARFWTVAKCRHGQVLFTDAGVFKYPDGQSTGYLIAQQPPSVGVAVCASCAIPGILDGMPFAGEVLFDGALCADGEVPIQVVERHFKAKDALIVAIDVGEDAMKKHRWLRFFWNLLCVGKCQIDGVHPDERDGLILIKPDIKGFHGLQFELSRDLKWRAVVGGFVSTAQDICAHELVAGAEKLELQRFISKFAEIENSSGEKGEFAAQVESFLGQNALL